jgi:hypothetical protein
MLVFSDLRNYIKIMFKNKNKFLLAIAVVGIIVGFSLQFSNAWVDAPANPPANNVLAPLNAGGAAQTKTGILGVTGLSSSGNITASGVIAAGGLSPSSAGDIAGGRLCIGSDCRNSWPVGGGGTGTVTDISAGSGITLSPNPITSTGSISADVNYIQQRISGSCAANQYIKSINADGTVVCSAMGAPTCTFGGRIYSQGATCMTPCSGNSGPGISKQCLSDGTWAGSGTCYNYNMAACGT